MQDTIAIVGAGWAGLSAAVRLARAGRRVGLFEAARAPGGRAREARLDFGEGAITLDAGQHLLVGAYRETLALADLLHAGEPPYRRFPMALRDTAGLRLDAARLPAPLHLVAALLRARGLTVAERVAIARLIATLRRPHGDAAPRETVAAMLARLRQPPALIERLWSPLCLAALNTPVEHACAITFATVLRDTLGAERAASDFVLPRSTLGELIAQPASAWLLAHGATLNRGAAVRAIAPSGARWSLRIGDAAGETTVDAAQVVIALPAYGAARLLAPLCRDTTPRDSPVARLEAFEYDAITTVFLAWPASRVPDLPRWVMLREAPGAGEHGQWLFDRGRFGAQRIAAVVISARGRLSDAPVAVVADGVARQVAAQLGVPRPTAHRTVTEKRATFRCTPQRPRIGVDALAGRLPGLWLAGDFTWPDYPATLESAVRSGRSAAELALRFDAAQARGGLAA